MAIDHPFRQTQPKTHTIDSGRSCRIGPKEALEDVRLRLRIDADTSVANGEPCHRFFLRNRDDNAATARSELDGVVEQIEDDPLEPIRITQDDTCALFALEHDPFRLGDGLQLIDERSGEPAQIDGVAHERNLPGLRLGEHENLVD